MSYCDFFQYTGQAVGAEQKDLWSFAETSCHLKTQQNRLCKHLGKCSKKQSIFRLKKMHGVQTAHFDSYSFLICSSDRHAESNTTLPVTHFCLESFIGRIINSLCQSLLQKAFTRGSKQTKRCQLTRKRLR